MVDERQHVGGFEEQFGRPAHDEPMHEPEALSVRTLLWWVLGLVIFVGFVFGAMVMLYYSLMAVELEPPRVAAEPPLDEEPAPPRPPGLIIDPGEDRRRLRELEQQRLHEFGWNRPEEEIARIPIDRAIEWVAERGVPFGPEPEEDD
jgi:hypothetical protein